MNKQLTDNQSRQALYSSYGALVKRGTKLFKVRFIDEEFKGVELSTKEEVIFNSYYYNFRKQSGLLK